MESLVTLVQQHMALAVQQTVYTVTVAFSSEELCHGQCPMKVKSEENYLPVIPAGMSTRWKDSCWRLALYQLVSPGELGGGFSISTAHIDSHLHWRHAQPLLSLSRPKP